VKYLQTSFHCPVCDVEVHKTKPLLYIRPDRTLQEIVYKLVPGLYQGELKRRHDFDEKEREENISTEENGAASVNKDEKQVEMKDPVCITLECYRRKRNWMEKQIFPTRYLRCPSAVTVNVLKRFLVMKFAIPNTHQVEVIRCDEILPGHLTMTEVSQIYGLYAKSFLDLEYTFLEVATDEPARLENKNFVVIPQKKVKRKKKRKKEMTEIKTEQTTSEETAQPACKLAKLGKCHVEPVSQNDVLPTFPDSPPSFDNVPCATQIESPA